MCHQEKVPLVKDESIVLYVFIKRIHSRSSRIFTDDVERPENFSMVVNKDSTT